MIVLNIEGDELAEYSSAYPDYPMCILTIVLFVQFNTHTFKPRL